MLSVQQMFSKEEAAQAEVAAATSTAAERNEDEQTRCHKTALLSYFVIQQQHENA